MNRFPISPRQAASHLPPFVVDLISDDDDDEPKKKSPGAGKKETIILDDDDSDDALPLNEWVRRQEQRSNEKARQAAKAAKAAEEDDDELDLTLSELVKRDEMRNQMVRKQQELERMRVQQEQQERMRVQQEEAARERQREQLEQAARDLAAAQQRAALERERQAAERARQQAAMEAAAAQRERDRQKAAMEAAADTADVDSTLYRTMRRTLLRGLQTEEERQQNVRELRRLRKQFASSGAKYKASPVAPFNGDLTREQDNYLGQFPTFQIPHAKASPRTRHMLFTQKKRREAEFVHRTIDAERALAKAKARPKSAVVFIQTHGAFFKEGTYNPVVPAGMTVTRAALATPGALRWGKQDLGTCVPYEQHRPIYKMIQDGVAKYKRMFPEDGNYMNPPDLLHMIELNINDACHSDFINITDVKDKIVKTAFCREHVSLQYMMYTEGQPIAPKMFARNQSSFEARFNIYVTDANGKVSKVWKDRPLKQQISIGQLLDYLKRAGFLNVILIDSSCQFFSETHEMKPDEAEARRVELRDLYYSRFFLGGGAGSGGAGYAAPSVDAFGMQTI